MTLLVSLTAFPSKVMLQAALNSGCRVTEPSIMGEWTKDSRDLPVGFKDIVTNHPKRTKFASIERKPEGWVVK